jgi:hypothetical protein
MGSHESQEYGERSIHLPMIGAVSPGILIPPAGALIPYRRSWPPRVVPVVEVLFQETGFGRDNGGNAYFYDRQGYLYDPRLKGLFMDAYY